MTKEERIQKLHELKSQAEAKAIAWNAAMTEGKIDDANHIDTDLRETIADYTASARALCYEECQTSGDPMMEAIKRLTFTTIAVFDDKVGDEKIVVRSIVEKQKPIDLIKLHKRTKGGIGQDPKWIYMAEKMNFLLTAKKAVELGIDPREINDSYAMSDIAREFDLGKNPASNTKLLASVQGIVTAMVGDGYKATSHDVNYIASVYSKKGRGQLTVVSANFKTFAAILADICHHIVTGDGYKLTGYDRKKDK